MGFVYAALWLVLAGLLYFRFRRQSKVVYPLTAYFLFLSIWCAVNEFVSVDILHGIYGWILRGVSAVMLGLCLIVYHTERKRSAGQENTEPEEK